MARREIPPPRVAPADAAVAEPAGHTAPPTPDPDAFRPSEKQRLAKAKLAIAMRHDPLLNAASTPAQQLAALVGVAEQTYRDWLTNPRFKGWFTAKHETEEKAEFLLDGFLDMLGNRLAAMSDKDFIQAGKLLIDAVSRGREAAAPAPDLTQYTPDQLVSLIGRLVPTLRLPGTGPDSTKEKP